MISLIIYTDGGSRGNPGPAATGYIIYCEGKVIHQAGAFIGTTTNNVAEYTAVLKALEWLSQHSEITRRQELTINFHLDSQLVVEQLSGRFKLKHPALTILAGQILGYGIKLKARMNFIRIPREQNGYADYLVNQTLNRELL